MPRAPVPTPQPLDAAAKREQARLLEAFGTALREVRHERLLTIEAVAEAAGLHPNYLGSVERGERNVSLFNIWRIAAALGVSSAALLDALPKRKVKAAVPNRVAPS
ncbi:Helix-turn-helix [Polaromonas sp. OV174]|uniref:helix-turn-helix domain-containing protein n=1 Tax=Polaromonas sp. OV174 TaxID=1855300 RepID=UPI0008E53C9E|nr:helix-turn-helix transcriptional regulator [Polaromonas sp. OV174]SFC11473.1 Helix-turn-helix [Polaromonas sp. OV174]